MNWFKWFAVFWLIPSVVSAADLSVEIQVKLQAAMVTHVDAVVVDGAYTYVDTQSGRLKTVYPSNVHPFVLEIGDDFFVCSEMISEVGETVTADFLVRNFEGSFRVVQMIIDNRAAVESAVEQSSQ
jgi:hypothetical protein